MRSAGSASPACPSPAGAARGSQLRHLSGGQCWITFLRSRAIASSSSWLLCSITSCGGGSSVEMRCRVCSVCSSISPLALAKAAVTPTGIHRISVFGSAPPSRIFLNVSEEPVEVHVSLDEMRGCHERACDLAKGWTRVLFPSMAAFGKQQQRKTGKIQPTTLRGSAPRPPC